MIERLTLALNSYLGLAFISTLILLVLLVIVDRLYTWRYRKLSKIASNTYYQRMLCNLKTFHNYCEGSEGFFGKIFKAYSDEYKFYGYGTVIPENLTQRNLCKRYLIMTEAVKTLKYPALASHFWGHYKDAWIVAQKGLVRFDGQIRYTVKDFFHDQRLVISNIEKMLLELAVAIQGIHNLKDEDGKPYYHGMIIPEHVFFQLDNNKNANRLILAYNAMAYSWGSDNIYRRIKDFFHDGEDNNIAPEQLDSERLHEVGTATDFYGYAALAISIFNKSPFRRSDSDMWKSVPLRWQAFLRSCLFDCCDLRPKSFDTLFESTITPEDIDLEKYNYISKLIDGGVAALNSKRWNVAEKYFKEVVKLDENSAEGNAGLAAVCRHLGETEKVEIYLSRIKGGDFDKIKSLGLHIVE